jgi:hypothetical protein
MSQHAASTEPRSEMRKTRGDREYATAESVQSASSATPLPFASAELMSLSGQFVDTTQSLRKRRVCVPVKCLVQHASSGPHLALSCATSTFDAAMEGESHDLETSAED